jgi:hypothetical protein
VVFGVAVEGRRKGRGISGERDQGKCIILFIRFFCPTTTMSLSKPFLLPIHIPAPFQQSSVNRFLFSLDSFYRSVVHYLLPLSLSLSLFPTTNHHHPAFSGFFFLVSVVVGSR